MVSYSKIFSDYQQSAFTKSRLRFQGTRIWLSPNPDETNGSPPLLILLTGNGLAVQYPNRLQFISPGGQRKWARPVSSGFFIVQHGSNIFYRNGPSYLEAVDPSGAPVMRDFFVPNAGDRGRFDVMFPVDAGNFFLQTYVLAKEVKVGKGPGKNRFSVMVKGNRSFDDWKYLKEFDGSVVPGLMNSDLTQCVVADNSGLVRVFEISTGEVVSSFQLQVSEVLNASLDHEAKLVVVELTRALNLRIAAYTLKDEKNKVPVWNTDLPGGQGTHPPQAPAISSANRVYYVANNTLFAIDAGKEAWRLPLIPSPNFQFVTILGDNSCVVTSANTIRQVSQEGKGLHLELLPPNEEITTPPVIDDKGKLYFGTSAGIYCYE